MITVTPELLDEVVRRLVDTFHPGRIYLFGSHAWGTPGPDRVFKYGSAYGN